jgi:hypothetical protein
MSDLAWTKAAALLKLNRAEGWPASLRTDQLARLQAGRWDTEAEAIAATLEDACKADRLAHQAEQVTLGPRYRVKYDRNPFASQEWLERDFPRAAAPSQPQHKTTIYKLSPEVFAGWLAQNKQQPAELVAAWLDATGHRAVAQPTAQAAPEQVQPAAAAPRRKQRQRDLMAGVIEAAQRECSDPQDTTAVWLILERKAAAGERPFKGKTEDGLKWVDEKDDVRFLTRKMLRERITPRSKKTRNPQLRRVK